MRTPLSRLLTLAAGGAILCVGAATRADWDVGDPAKWVQLPDLTDTGMDVEAMSPITLADDWLCKSTDPVTDIHIWGSWLNNVKPSDMSLVQFSLGIWSDVAASGNNTSHPGTELWQTVTTPTASRLYSAAATEQFIDPTGSNLGSDGEVWQYNFLNLKDSQNQTFVQQGTAGIPVTYWLSVQVVNAPAGTTFGWKTAATQQLDDACYQTTASANWVDLQNPQTTAPSASLDLAFVITPEPSSLALMGLGILALCRRTRKA